MVRGGDLVGLVYLAGSRFGGSGGSGGSSGVGGLVVVCVMWRVVLVQS